MSGYPPVTSSPVGPVSAPAAPWGAPDAAVTNQAGSNAVTRDAGRTDPELDTIGADLDDLAARLHTLTAQLDALTAELRQHTQGDGR